MKLKLSRNVFLTIKCIVWILFSIYAISIIINHYSFDLKISVLLSGVLIEFTLITFLNHWFRYKQPYLLDWFRLGTFITIVLNFMFMVGTLNSGVNILVNDVVVVNTSQALPTLLATLIGLLALRIGEIIVIGLKKQNRVKQLSVQKFKHSICFKRKTSFLIFTFFLVAVQLFLMIKGIVGYGVYTEHTTASYSFMIQAIGIMGPFVLAIFAIVKFGFKYENKLFDIIFFLYFLMQIILGFLSGMKEDIISPILIVIIPYLLGGNKIPIRLFVIGFVFFILLYPINNNYRYLTNKHSNVDKITFLKLAVAETFKGDFTENFVDGTESYQGRLSLFPLFMYSVENEKQWNEYKNLNRYIFLPVAWIIPRFILKSKPTSTTGSRLYYMTSGKITSSITPSTYGWSYLEGGYIQLFISFFLFGIFITLLQLNLNKKTMFGLLLYIVILVSLLKVESDIYFKISEILQSIFIGFIIYRLFFKVKSVKIYN